MLLNPDLRRDILPTSLQIGPTGRPFGDGDSSSTIITTSTSDILSSNVPTTAPSSVASVTPAPSTAADSVTSLITSTISSSTSPASATPTSTESHAEKSFSKYVLIIVILVVLLAALAFGYYQLRVARRKNKNPKYIPTKYLKGVWEKWEPGSSRTRLPNKNNEHLEHVSMTTQTPNPSSPSATELNRPASLYSVLTLPVYNTTAAEDEQVLGREGERGGVDVVVDFPETYDEEESRREEEMDGMYRVRMARRQENEDREERRRLRREARARGDTDALRELQTQAHQPSAARQELEEQRSNVDRLRAERASRAVTSVSYGDLGVARHDGTRLRATSPSSERRGLLDDSASIAASSNYHRRDRSTSSVLSINTDMSDLRPMTSSGMSTSHASSLHQVNTNQTDEEGRAGSSPEMIEHEDLPPNSPPGYENVSLDSPQVQRQPTATGLPPQYSSPVLTRNPTFPKTTGPSSVRTEDASSVSPESNSPSNIHTPSASSSASVPTLPQLQFLRTTSIPSIQVDPGSPAIRRPSETGYFN